jgi:hypothetical protein
VQGFHNPLAIGRNLVRPLPAVLRPVQADVVRVLPGLDLLRGHVFDFCIPEKRLQITRPEQHLPHRHCRYNPGAGLFGALHHVR